MGLHISYYVLRSAGASMAGSDYSEVLFILSGAGSVALYLETAGAAAKNNVSSTGWTGFPGTPGSASEWQSGADHEDFFRGNLES